MRIAIDVPASLRTLEQLRGARDGMDHAAADLIRPHFGLFPPDVLGFMVPWQLQLSSGLGQGATTVQLERRRIAARIASFQVADGGAVDPAISAVLEEGTERPNVSPVTPPGFLMRLLKAEGEGLSFLGTGVEGIELGILGLLRFQERSLPAGARVPFKDFQRAMQEKFVGRTGSRVLSGAGIAISLKQNYDSSSSATRFGSAFSSAAATGLVTLIPYSGLADAATGGGIAASVDANVVLLEAGVRVFRDPADAGKVLTNWSEDALAGKHGWAFREISEFGWGLGEKSYEVGQALSHAGERLGGAMHETAGKVNSLVHNIHRPKWLGG